MFDILTGKLLIFGAEIPIWLVVVGAVAAMLVIYAWAQKAKAPH